MTSFIIQAVAHPVLRHRIATNFNADAEGITTDDVIDRLLKEVREPSPEEYAPKKAAAKPKKVAS